MTLTKKNFIPFDTMSFGTEDDSYCGICGSPEEGCWKNGLLREDIICNYCRKEWEWDGCREGYIRKSALIKCSQKDCDEKDIELEVCDGCKKPFCDFDIFKCDDCGDDLCSKCGDFETDECDSDVAFCHVCFNKK